MNKLIIIILSLSIISMIGCQNETKHNTKIEPSQLQRVGGPIEISKQQKLTSNELGIESITELEDGSYRINIYSLNIDIIAGVQFELLPNNIFELEQMTGGRCEDAGFMMKSSKNGTMLGFSMQGNTINPSQTFDKNSNILFSLTANLVSDKTTATFSLVPVLAGPKGVTLKVDSVPFNWKK